MPGVREGKVNTKVHFSSASDEWATPSDVYAALDSEFHFDFDPCPLNPTFDGLASNLGWGLRNFINPPYSQKLKEAFIHKALEESRKGKLCVMLLPVSTSTKIFHEVIKPNAKEIRFVKGRIKFDYCGIHDPKRNGGMHDSMIVIFK